MTVMGEVGSHWLLSCLILRDYLLKRTLELSSQD